jgi:lipid-A-disaccharide synthase
LSVTRRQETYFISAGEHSGDMLAAELAVSLRDELPRLAPVGIVGQGMREAGVYPLASIDVFSVMGVFEIAKKLADFRMLSQQIVRSIERLKPQFAILVDNPGFHFFLAEQLHLRRIPVIQYVAPKLWAWGEGRAAMLKRDFMHVLGILPFEQEFFVSRGIPYSYVGTPQKDRAKRVIVDRATLGLPAAPLFAFLPGSRTAELDRLVPMMVQIRQQIAAQVPGAKFVIPAARNLGRGAILERLPVDNGPGEAPLLNGVFKSGFHVVDGMSQELMAAADVAVVASGTATLECALLGTPMVVVYAMSDFTFAIAKQKVKLPYVSLCSLVAGKAVVREFLQEFSAGEVAGEAVKLLHDKAYRQQMIDDFSAMTDKLQGNAAETAAKKIASIMNAAPKRAST